MERPWLQRALDSGEVAEQDAKVGVVISELRGPCRPGRVALRVDADDLNLPPTPLGPRYGVSKENRDVAELCEIAQWSYGEVWLPATSNYEGSARLGLVKIVRQRGESEFSNYRKFTVDTLSSFVPPPVKP